MTAESKVLSSKGQLHGVAFDEHHVGQALRALTRNVKHVRGEVETANKYIGVFLGEHRGDVTRATTHVKDQARTLGVRARLERGIAQRTLPETVHAEADTVICRVIAIGDRFEYPVNVFLGHRFSLLASHGAP